ncbi:hypothetical protein a10_01584 [Streptomyces acidiscabies]|nr:hypothetical protein a10_01584 [Streptomyces acidiscabies]GAV37715.1 hypothetical protein Saa2_00589 [Streptomyces acidiscabies]
MQPAVRPTERGRGDGDRGCLGHVGERQKVLRPWEQNPGSGRTVGPAGRIPGAPTRRREPRQGGSGSRTRWRGRAQRVLRTGTNRPCRARAAQPLSLPRRTGHPASAEGLPVRPGLSRGTETVRPRRRPSRTAQQPLDAPQDAGLPAVAQEPPSQARHPHRAGRTRGDAPRPLPGPGHRVRVPRSLAQDLRPLRAGIPAGGRTATGPQGRRVTCIQVRVHGQGAVTTAELSSVAASKENRSAQALLPEEDPSA